MKLLIDMNLPPVWIHVFEEEGWEARHWSTTGKPDATDEVLLDWAR